MLDVLCPLITESDIVSNELLDIILMNIVEPNKTQKKNAYLLAKELVIKCSDTLEPYIQAVSNEKYQKSLSTNKYFLNSTCSILNFVL
jgi:sister-chromatid-cohesion protein PDS5